ncbi:SMI1/KNR4 family protein [Actinomadura rudentiformis]|uniref:SMI1/KNR4 family protein n=1 Tax=Actinomadura rudentiformis TaxID=359158 RepID=UPI001CEF5B79|nr:SMI1/KNR4 family protein [Actinomadura rudentiformis]
MVGEFRGVFAGLDLGEFWDNHDYALSAYVETPPSSESVASVQAELGYRLPASYVGMMSFQNSGVPRRTCCPAPNPTTWADDHVAVDGIMGIGRSKRCSLSGEAGSRFWIQEWGYPPIGVYFATCPSAGHDMIAFDYRGCGPDGEPRIVHVDQEWDYQITVLAPDFASFVRALRPETDYDHV